MVHLISITSQGQISIPAVMRRDMQLDMYKKVFIRRIGKQIIIEPVENILSLAGSLHAYARKNKSLKSTIKSEDTVWEQAAVERYRKTLPQ